MPRAPHHSSRLRAMVLLLLALGGTVIPGYALIETIVLSYVFSGAPHPTPLVLTLEDGLSPNTVRLNLDASGLAGTEFVSGWYLNLDPALNASALTFAIVSNPTALSLADIKLGTDVYKADGDGHYDILFDLPPPPGSFAAKFTDGEQLIVDIFHAGGLSVADFFYESVNSSGNGVYYSAAHIQGINGTADGDPSGSAWIGANSLSVIPEPSHYAVFAGLFTLALAVFRRQPHPAGLR